MNIDRVTIGACELLCARAEEALPTLPDASVHLIIADPPFWNFKLQYGGERVEWDRQWQTREAYLAWLKEIAVEWRRVLMPNGSLYVFAAPQMAAWVEVTLSEGFHVLNRIQWLKEDGWHKKAEKEALCSFLSAREEIIFCEQYASDAYAMGEAGYDAAKRGLKTSLFSAPIAEAMAGTHSTAKEVTEAIGAYGKVNHGGAVSNWLQGYNIPTRDHYEAMRTFFNTKARQEYSYLRQEYEDLRQEYEDLRRPFTVSPSVPYTDVFTFKTVPASPEKHPCQKPLPLLRHLIEVSSRPGDVVLDPFMGSGSTLEAAKQCGRKSIGIEMDQRWYQKSIRRISQEILF